MTRADCVRELLRAYQDRRAQNERELDMRVEEAARLQPEIARLREENRALAFSTVREMMALTDADARQACAERMKQRGLFNNGEIRRLLREAGLPEDHLEIKYRCNLCRDTGYVGDAPARFCSCFEAELRRMLVEDGSMADPAEQSFERFDASVFSEADGQRAKALDVRDYCEEYANSFPNTKYLNLVLVGNAGLGKSFLLNCIYERVMRRGLPALRVSAFRMFETMRAQHFANSDEDRRFEELVNAPLLLIDDLGTEPFMNNITVEYLFTLLDERMSARRHTVIATNLYPPEFKKRYGERLLSRLLDKRRSVAVELIGKDVRLG